MLIYEYSRQWLADHDGWRTSGRVGLGFRGLSGVVIAAGALLAVPLAAQTTPPPAPPAPAVIHACYVPLTGTLYRIKETDLRQTCTSPSNVEFSWTDGAGAVHGTDAATGDLGGTFALPSVIGLQGHPVANTVPTTGQVLTFDGTQWAPAAVPTQKAGGIAGYEAVQTTVTNPNGYGAPFVVIDTTITILGDEPALVPYAYHYRVISQAADANAACPAGKKALSVNAREDATRTSVPAEIASDGTIKAILPTLQRDGPFEHIDKAPDNMTAAQLQAYIGAPPSGALPDQSPDKFVLSAVCAITQ